MESKNPLVALKNSRNMFFKLSGFMKYVSFCIVSAEVLQCHSSLKKSLLVLTALFIFFSSFGQIDGDYQTRASGDWSDYKTWQVRNGGAWVDCLTGDYPGANPGAGTVNILDGRDIYLTANIPNPVGAIYLDSPNSSTSIDLVAYSINVTGAVSFSGPSFFFNVQRIIIGDGTLTCASVSMPSPDAITKDVEITISTGNSQCEREYRNGRRL